MRWSAKILTGLIGIFCVSGLALAADRHVVVVNDTNYPMIAFYASNIGTNNWQENIIRGNTVQPSNRIRVNIDDGSAYCHFDLKAVFSNGASAVRRGADVCVLETWTIHDDE